MRAYFCEILFCRYIEGNGVVNSSRRERMLVAGRENGPVLSCGIGRALCEAYCNRAAEGSGFTASGRCGEGEKLICGAIVEKNGDLIAITPCELTFTVI